MYVLLSVASALFYGIADFSGGFATRRSPLFAVIALSQVAGASLAALFLVASGAPPPGLSDLGWGAAAGLVGLVGLLVLYKGIATGIVAIVSPVSALVSALLPAAFGLLLGERPSGLAALGALLCVPAIYLLSAGPSGKADPGAARRSLLEGLLAGAGFGGFFILLSRASPGAGLWPVFVARASSLAAVILFALARREPFVFAPGGKRIASLAGMADMGANILFLLATRTGLLSLVSVISSLFPAPTVVLARLFMKEKVPPSRIAGLGLAIAGVALIGL